jgi:hypothetical protein
MSVKKRAKRSTKAKAPKRAKRVKAKAAAPRKAIAARKPAKRRKKPRPAKAKAKTTTKKKVQAKKTQAKTAAPISRRDGSGHLNPRYKAELRALSRESNVKDDDRAFFNKARSTDDLAEELGEQAVETMNSGENEGEDVLDQTVPEEKGGPFVVTPAGTEFADGTDASNPKGATREPFPRT